MKKIILLFTILSVLAGAAVAQKKRKPHVKSASAQTDTTQAADKPVVEPADTLETGAPAKLPAKKNERAMDASTATETSEAGVPQKKNAHVEKTNKAVAAESMSFVYEFSQPKFYVSQVVIEHDAGGKGKITFKKQDWNDTQSDPLTISDKTLAKIQALWTTLNLLESTDTYQSPQRNYAHLGTMKLRQSEDGKTREVEFNWTENQTAKDLTDEYKKLTEQYLWIFDMNVARENQPLNSPQLIDRLDSLTARNQISDPKQMLAFLREIADDERIPLIARNHTTKLIQRIEKLKEEK